MGLTGTGAARNHVLRSLALMSGIAASPALAQEGPSLARDWCASCHLFPAPDLLDRDTWINNVLPEMGARLGFSDFRGNPYRADRSAPPGVYAEEPLLAAADWEKIIAYYEQAAPLAFEGSDETTPGALTQFSIEKPATTSFGIPATTAVFIDSVSGGLLVGDAREAALTVFSPDLDPLGEVYANGPFSRVSRMSDGAYLATTMGAIGREVEPVGTLSVVYAAPDAPGKFRRSTLVSELLRPVDALVLDVNHDELKDFAVADFGRYSGSLSLHIAEPGGSFLEVALLDEDGTISIERDGDDLIALTAQANERIVRFADLGGIRPSAEVLMRFPPSQGSSSLTLLDFNEDGLADLLYTAGDNADISPIFKPYHGVYLYLGEADGSFRQEMFWHLDGAYGAVARDFDGDGDKDIAAVAYFADFAVDPARAGFLYLENTGGQFKEKRIDGIGHLGRWAVISAGDIDADGDDDIVLGNLAYGAVGPADVPTDLRDRWIDGPAFVLLRNGLN